MITKKIAILASFALGITLSNCKNDDEANSNQSTLMPGLTVSEGAIDTKLINRETAVHIEEDWGKLDLHLNESNTYGTEKMVTGIADINPDQQIHPPHAHEEEEFLYISEGSGIWTVEDKEIEAKKGDLLYAQPWKLHGVKNTGSNTLTFHFFKWNNRGVKVPAESDAIDAMGAILTSVIDKDSSQFIEENWGTLNLYANEKTTYGMEKMVTGVANIEPGQEIHPPHTHEEEEFLYIVSGTGIWTINDQEVEAKPGDLLYAKPQDLHGVKNTGDTILTFYFIKWNNKGVVVPN